VTRRELLAQAGFLLASQNVRAAGNTYDWIRACRCVIFEAYNPPFYPSFDYAPEKAIGIVKDLRADSFRYPAASYYANFPTGTKYPVHPELKGDPMRRTLELADQAGLRKIAYLPLNHPFMEVTSKNSNFRDWTKRFPDGEPMTTEHYGFVKYYEGCLNSPVRDVIKEMVRETLVNYSFDVLYFDGPYMGMQNARNFCHCPYCQAAYQEARGRKVPLQDRSLDREAEIEYTEWMARDVVIAFLREIREMIRATRDVPVLYNDTSLLSRREWRNRAIPVVDGFMFEAAESPEEKLFNLELGHSTGKVIWTYVGTHTQYNREHMKNERVRGWFSYPVESEELLIDGATAAAAGTGLKYWGLSRFFYMPKPPGEYESGRYVREVFDFARKHDALLRSVKSQPVAGIMVSPQTIDWYEGGKFVGKAYENAPRGAWQLFKDLSYDSRPFLDYLATPEQLRRLPLLYLPNAACLSEKQCDMLRAYVSDGGILIATHMTSVADEHGRPRASFGLEDLFGVVLREKEPVEIPDLYLRLPDGEEIPQDPQAVPIRVKDAEVLGETIDRGHRRNLGPAMVRRKHGKGVVYYIASSPESVYAETRMKRLREYYDQFFQPLLRQHQTYRAPFRSGLLPHLTASSDTILLHLIADTGNKFKKLRAREEFVPLRDVRAAVRVPEGRTVKSVSLLRSGVRVETESKGGFIHAVIPEIFIHEALRVDLA
jgi:hypothetical protein